MYTSSRAEQTKYSLLQVRLQMRQGDATRSMRATFVEVMRTDGARGLYRGLSASLLRQMSYSTVRFGLYEASKARASLWWGCKDGRDAVPFAVLVGLAAGSGFVGGLVGNAADMLNVRMQHDAALPPAQRRNYRHAIEGLLRVAREEGLARGWFRGWWPNSIRAAAMTASQLATYDLIKRLLLRYTPLHDTLATHFTASVLAGAAAATVTNPIDVVKTRIMSSGSRTGGLVRLVRETTRAEGVTWIFKGWVPSFLRLGPCDSLYRFSLLDTACSLITLVE